MGIYFGDLIIGSGSSNNNNNNNNVSIPYMTKITLTTTGWDTTTLTQVATIEGIKADETTQAIYINPVFDDTMIDEIGNCNVHASAQGENSITFSCDSVPTINVEFYVKWQDVIWIEPPVIEPNITNYSITTISNSTNSFTCEPGTTWENFIDTRIGEHPGTLLEDEYGNLYVKEDTSPEEIQSRIARSYTYHLVDENNKKIHKNDIITSQNYHFEYLFFNMTGVYNISYTFDYGMTLEEWCNSEYNTDGWWADDTGITNLDYMSYEVNKNTILESNMTINVEQFCCFIEGTQIATSLNGDTQPIETLKEEDLVVSYNVNTKENYLTKVKKLITNPYSISMAKVYLNNGTILEMTDYHPLYTIEGFKSITDKKYPELKIGDILPTFDNKETIITNIELYKNENPITTYTLDVIDLDENIDNDITDNYYANEIIAHNTAGCDLL